MLLPIPSEYCPASCIQPIPFNVIPNFDFLGNDIRSFTSPSNMVNAENTCMSTSNCVGFNSVGCSKNNFQNPKIISGINVYVSSVFPDSKFMVVNGFDNGGVAMNKYRSISPTECARVCSYSSGCIGAVYTVLPWLYCTLIKSFASPQVADNTVMLLPLKLGANGEISTNLCFNCPAGYEVSLIFNGQCSKCGANTYSPGGNIVCKACHQVRIQNQAVVLVPRVQVINTG